MRRNSIRLQSFESVKLLTNYGELDLHSVSKTLEGFFWEKTVAKSPSPPLPNHRTRVLLINPLPSHQFPFPLLVIFIIIFSLTNLTSTSTPTPNTSAMSSPHRPQSFRGSETIQSPILKIQILSVASRFWAPPLLVSFWTQCTKKTKTIGFWQLMGFWHFGVRCLSTFLWVTWPHRWDLLWTINCWTTRGVTRRRLRLPLDGFWSKVAGNVCIVLVQVWITLMSINVGFKLKYPNSSTLDFCLITGTFECIDVVDSSSLF